MARLEQITSAGYKVKVQWECEFDDAGIHSNCSPTQVCQSPLCTRDALYGVKTEAMRLHYKAQEGETIQYVYVMSLYPYICKYFKSPWAIQSSMWETRANTRKSACVRMAL